MTEPATSADISAIKERYLNAGVVPPDDREAGTYANAQRLLATLHWLRQPRTVAAEPSNIFQYGARP